MSAAQPSRRSLATAREAAFTARGSRVVVALTNLHSVAGIYGTRVANTALSILGRRVKSLLGNGINVTCDAPGASLIVSGVYESALAESAGDLWAAIADAVGQPIDVDGALIVLAATPVKSDVEAPPTPGAFSAGEAELFRADMARAAVAFGALMSGEAAFAEQAIVSPAEIGLELYRERLIRVRDEEARLIPAHDLLASIERLRLTRAFDYLVVQATLAELRARPKAVLGCNISALSALDDDWWHQFVAEMADRPDIARRLVVEVTETAQLPDAESACRFIAALQACGCRVAIDDFGTGASSIAFVSCSGVDIIKLDGSFIRGCHTKPSSQALLGHLLSLVTHFASAIVVEGIETEQELGCARATGAHWVQGFHIDVLVESALDAAKEAASASDLFGGLLVQ